MGHWVASGHIGDPKVSSESYAENLEYKLLKNSDKTVECNVVRLALIQILIDVWSSFIPSIVGFVCWHIVVTEYRGRLIWLWPGQRPTGLFVCHQDDHTREKAAGLHQGSDRYLSMVDQTGGYIYWVQAILCEQSSVVVYK